MNIVVIHNAYQHRGGEDAVVEAEIALLRSYGHEVAVYRRHNDEIPTMSRATAAMGALWSTSCADELEQLCDAFHPQVIHAHNTFPLISPAFSWMAARKKIPVVQTLHNFRLLCPQAMFLRQGQVCTDCLGKIPWRAVARQCYRHSGTQSAVAAGTLVLHRVLGTYQHRITRYIALNTFCRDKFIAGGLPAERMQIKPNFVSAQALPAWTQRQGGLFVGRLAPEKGLDVFIAAMNIIDDKSIRVVGNGPMQAQVQAAFGVNYLGARGHATVLDLLRGAQFLVAPSTCYETFGLSIVEAFACGTPVIASGHGGFAELVQDGVTGLLCTPGDAQDLAGKITWAQTHPEAMRKMGQAARIEYEAKYTPQRNYKMLMGIYENAIDARFTQP